MNDLFRHYMLSEHNEAARDQMRERLLADQAFSDEFRESENEWIDAYAAGTLAPAERTLLHTHLVNTGQLHRLATAAALAGPKPAPARSVYPYAFAIAAIVLLCFGVFLTSERRTFEIARTPPPAAVFALTPGTLRDSSAVQAIPVKQGDQIHLLYQDTAPVGICLVTLKNGERGSLEESGSTCGVDLHSHTLGQTLPPGRYTVELADSQRQLIHTYLFDVPN